MSRGVIQPSTALSARGATLGFWIVGMIGAWVTLSLVVMVSSGLSVWSSARLALNESEFDEPVVLFPEVGFDDDGDNSLMGDDTPASVPASAVFGFAVVDPRGDVAWSNLSACAVRVASID